MLSERSVFPMIDKAIWIAKTLRAIRRKNWCSGLFCVFSMLPLNVLSDESKDGADDILNSVRAQFVYNFINYVTWPDEAFRKKESTIDICLFGHVEFENYLRAFEGVMIHGRGLNIVSTLNKSDIKNGCHLLFVSESLHVELPNFWNEINYIYVLSVGEESEFSEKGGIISVFRTSDRMQFDINISNAINNGLSIDSDLLSLARILRRNGPLPAPTAAPSNAFDTKKSRPQ